MRFITLVIVSLIVGFILSWCMVDWKWKDYIIPTLVTATIITIMITLITYIAFGNQSIIALFRWGE